MNDKPMREIQYKGFTVKDDGTIINRFGNKVGFANGHGYIYVQVGKSRIPAHRFIWEAFNGEIPNGMEIDHINTIRTDNHLENLRLVTSSENKRNPITLAKYKESNKGKDSYLRRMKASMGMWMMNQIKRYHKELSKNSK